MMADFLLELLSEEMPARMQARAADTLARMFAEAANKAGVPFSSRKAYVTPRRLALHVCGLPLVQPDTTEEFKGPRTDAPPAAIAGFLKKVGRTLDQLETRSDGKKGDVYFAVVTRSGGATSAVLADITVSIVRNFAWPKSMRWGDASTSMDALRWVRPLQSILAIFAGEVVHCEIGGIKSGNTTRGHRFMSSAEFAVTDFEDYRGKLHAAHVILDPDERMKMIDAQARALAGSAGVVLVEDAGLLAENAGLTEWPVVLLGDFDPAFLEVPAEALTATMRTNQKYFSLRDASGKLASKFLCVANLAASDGGKSIIAGNEKVLAARLSDAKFFWDQDRKQKLEDYLPKLEQIIFHEKLGTMAEKVARVENLAEHIARELYPQFTAGHNAVTPAQAGVQFRGASQKLDPSLRWGDIESFVADVKRAAKLCKADLVTGMVGEFPELQGIMGRYYALARGESESVATAIAEHYQPQGPFDAVPTSPVSVCVALADKIDTLAGFFDVELIPTGSSDPFALRRAALAICSIIQENRLSFNLSLFIQKALEPRLVAAAITASAQAFRDVGPEIDGAAKVGAPLAYIKAEIIDPREAAARGEYQTQIEPNYNELVGELMDFIRDRLKVRQRELGIPADVLDAAFSLQMADINQIIGLVGALKDFLQSDDGKSLLAGFKRAVNILKIEEAKDGMSYVTDGIIIPPTYAHEAEHLLSQELHRQLELLKTHKSMDDLPEALVGLAKLRPSVDNFFAKLKVNDADRSTRARRLQLLSGVRSVMLMVADFSKIEG